MKPILFPEGQTDFSTNGVGRLSDAISCTVTEERNGQYELHMEYPIDGQHMEDVKYSRIILATPADGKRPQPFRIYRITKPLSGVVEIDAEHISYQMTHIPIMPFSVDGLTPAFEGFTTYAAEKNPFTFRHEGSFGEALAHSFDVKQPDNLRSLLFGQDGSVIDVFGGEWEFDRYDVILHKARGSDNGVTIRYGKNLTDLKQEENIENTYTGICPYWKGQLEDGSEVMVTLPEGVIHSEFADNYPYQRTKIVDFSSSFQTEPTIEELRERGEKYIESNDVGTPKVSLETSFIALHQTQEYADLTRIEHINLCDTITVQFPLLNVSTKAKVVKTVWNVLLDRYDSITIGAVQSRLSATLQASQEKAVEQAVQQSASQASTEYATKAVTTALSRALGAVDSRLYKAEDSIEAVTGVSGGYVFITIDENKQSDELIVLVDSPVFSAAQKVFRLSENGLCYTSGGYEKGSWSVIIDTHGRLNASALTGILKDEESKNSWNLTTGILSLAADVTFGGKTIDEIIAEIKTDVEDTISTAIQDYDDSLNRESVLEKLTTASNPETGESSVDNGFYLGSDGLLRMLPERVVTDGANIPVCYLPTTIVDGVVTSYTQARVENGIIYPPMTTGANTEADTENGTETSETIEEVS